MTFSFIQISDHHLTAKESLLTRGFSTNYAFGKVLRHISEHARSGDAMAPSFIVSTGDLGDVNPPAGYRAARRLLNARREATMAPGPLTVSLHGTEETPLYVLPGNHDDLEAMAVTLFRRSSSRAAGIHGDRMHTRFEHEGIRFVIVDWGRRAKASSDSRMFDFLQEALEGDQPAVILTHHHVAPCGAAWLDDFIADDVDRFWEALRGKPVLGVLSGHIHMTTETVVEGIPVLTVRSTCYQFAHQDEPLPTLEAPQYRVVTIDGDKFSSRVVEVPLWTR
jgi:3',5'-cyclic AMP phosphodiesterase CpdA